LTEVLGKMNQLALKYARLCLIGMAPDTGNLGVSALCASVLSGLFEHSPTALVTVWDGKRGVRPFVWELGGKSIKMSRCGAYHTKRIYRNECLSNIRFCALFGGLWNGGAQSICSSDAILDISGGDSFTDMYGPWRFRAVTMPKLIALERRKTLVLLPQTYGPFIKSSTRDTAQKIVRSSVMAWARDERSFEVLKDLLGDSFDPCRHRVGVDVAFGLPVAVPDEKIIAKQREWFEDEFTPLVGVNVSGLLLNRLQESSVRYGFRADYRDVILAFLLRLLKESEARVLLIPHVVTPPGHYESDIEACETIASAFQGRFENRVSVAPVVHDPCEVKWIIGQCDWFCGTRMHSTIAALSQGVPTSAISYSPKTLGVFESCSLGAHVADPRKMDTQAVVDQLWLSWLNRESARRSLDAALPQVLKCAQSQMAEIVATCASSPSQCAARIR
jgi:colanic acid/amylovoran biosynthesis protein